MYEVVLTEIYFLIGTTPVKELH